MSYDFEGKSVFISGQMSGIPNFNKELFDAVESAFLNYGAAFVHNPAADVPKPSEAKPHEYYMVQSIHELTSTKQGEPFYDVVAILPGWENSAGALLEYMTACECGIPVIQFIGGEWK